jgi:hypothetical protein
VGKAVETAHPPAALFPTRLKPGANETEAAGADGILKTDPIAKSRPSPVGGVNRACRY